MRRRRGDSGITDPVRPLFALLAAAAAGVALALPLSAGGQAAGSEPPFARRYSGTATGKYTVSGGSSRRTDEWSVSGLAFQLAFARQSSIGWAGIYRLRGGTVVWRSSGTTQGCSYEVKRTFVLPASNSLLYDRIAFSETIRPRGRWTYHAQVDSEHRVPVTETCADEGGTYSRETTVNPFGTWLKTAALGHPFQPGGALRGSSTYRRSADGETQRSTWRWDLRPRR